MPEIITQASLIDGLLGVVGFIFSWWWLILPFLMYRPARYMWFWMKNNQFAAGVKYVILEVRTPGNSEKPFRAMESVFTGLWQAMHDPPNPAEAWLQGKFQLTFQIEIVSSEGEIHFYLRIPEGARKGVESAIYAQYPDVEFIEVDDYTKRVPQALPNKEWDLWGTNYIFKKSDVYPIKTYPKFFEAPGEGEEEGRVDPMSLLLEGLSRLDRGEQIWIQAILHPITPEDDYNYVDMGKETIDEFIQRPGIKKTGGGGLLGGGTAKDVRDAASLLLTGAPPEEAREDQRQEEGGPFAAELRLTMGERDVVAGIEQKISKYAFMGSIRFMYLAKRENYFGPSKAFPMLYFTQFSTHNLNGLRPLKATITKSYTFKTKFLDKRRAYAKKRRLFRQYTRRVHPFYPNKGGTILLNTEELATLFRFPGKFTAPTAPLTRIQTRRGGAPPELPGE